MINFLKYRRLYLAISLAILVPGVYSLVRWGLVPSIDFVGGTVLEIAKSEDVDIDAVEKKLQEQGAELESVRDDGASYVIRSKPIERDQWESVKASFASAPTATGSAETGEETETENENENETETESEEAERAIDDLLEVNDEEVTMSATPSAQIAGIDELRFETVGPVLGAELLQKTIIAAGLAVLGILLYIAWAFKNIRYGISALVALFHDVLVVFGIFSLLGHFYGVEVDVLFVTAILTTMSFSVHDTIVVFDRIRESLRRENLPFDVTVNKALTETMSRSVNNSMTIIFMLLALVLLGGDTIRWFSVALLIGTISGTYSSPFVATQVLYLLISPSKKSG